MRLSYHQRLAEFLPSAFEKMIPQKPEICYDLNDGNLFSLYFMI